MFDFTQPKKLLHPFKKLHDQRRSKTWVNIGDAVERWRRLRAPHISCQFHRKGEGVRHSIRLSQNLVCLISRLCRHKVVIRILIQSSKVIGQWNFKSWPFAWCVWVCLCVCVIVWLPTFSHSFEFTTVFPRGCAGAVWACVCSQRRREAVKWDEKQKQEAWKTLTSTQLLTDCYTYTQTHTLTSTQLLTDDY